MLVWLIQSAAEQDSSVSRGHPPAATGDNNTNEEEEERAYDEDNEKQFWGIDDRPFYRQYHPVLSGKLFNALSAMSVDRIQRSTLRR